MSSIVLGNRPIPVLAASQTALYLASPTLIQNPYTAAGLHFKAIKLATGELMYEGTIKVLLRDETNPSGPYIIIPEALLPVPAGVLRSHVATSWLESVGVTLSSYETQCTGPYARCSTSMCW